MSFEEDFPSLKGKISWQNKSFMTLAGEKMQETKTTYYIEEDIEEFCVDKQKVREAIEVLQELNELEKDALEVGLTEQLDGAIKRLKHRWEL